MARRCGLGGVLRLGVLVGTFGLGPTGGRARERAYRIEAFLPAAVLNGFDPEQNPHLGIFYAIRDTELGEQVLSVGPIFPTGKT